MSKILLLANSDIYNQRNELVQGLLAAGHQVCICTPVNDHTQYFNDLGCDFAEVSIDRHGMNPFTDLGLLHSYCRIIKQVRPDIALGFTIKPNIYGAMAARWYKVPFVANITGLGTAVEYPGLSQKITVTLYRVAFTRVQTVFFQNEENRQFFQDRRLALGKHKLLPGSGVNLERFKLVPYPAGEPVEFAFVARVMKEKGIEEYLEAARRIRQEWPGTVFHVCGDCESEYDGSLQQAVVDGTAIYHGRVDSMEEIYPHIHCMVLPSYYPEGLANVLLEACATGRPIITTDRAGCREVVDDGVNGYMIAQHSSTALTDALRQFLQLSPAQREEMGLAGRRKVEQEFDRAIVVEKYLGEVGAFL